MEETSHQQSLPNFIIGINNGFATLPISYANCILGDKKNLSNMVLKEGFYLPEFGSRCITTSYLFEVISLRVFNIRRDQVNRYLVEKQRWPKIDLLTLLEQRYVRDIKLGFDLEHMPDRQWLLNVIHTFDPQCEIFNGCKTTEKLVEIPLS